MCECKEVPSSMRNLKEVGVTYGDRQEGWGTSRETAVPGMMGHPLASLP